VRAIPNTLPVLLRAVAYAIRGGFLIRPFIIALALGIAGMVFSWAEEQAPEISALVPRIANTIETTVMIDVATSVRTACASVPMQ
jgi:hypothetical protein